MLYIATSFAVGLLLLLYNFSAQLRKLRYELSFLPQKGVNALQHSIIGKNLRGVFPDLAIAPAEYTIILVASPACAPCHQSLEEILAIRETLQHRFLCLVENSRPDDTDRFLQQFSGSVTLLPVDIEDLLSLELIQFPTFLLVDQNGRVIKEFTLLPFLLKFLSGIKKSDHTREENYV